jgi:tetratricopeptide (TPR) repeat protein
VGVVASLILLFAAEAPSLPDLSEAQLAARAEAAFQEGRRLRDNDESGQKEFQTAAASYEELRRRGVGNADLYRNLGHAYVLADDLPHAILSFRRGLRLAPHDSGLHRSLAGAREMVVYPAGSALGRPAVEWRPPWLPRVASHWLFLAGLLCYSGLCLSVTRWLMTRRGRLLVSAAVCLLLFSALTWTPLSAERRRAAEAEQTLVVIADDGVLLRKGDGLAYPPRYETPLNRGVEARLVHERPGWVQIEMAGGEIGWAPRRFVLIDRTESRPRSVP